MFQSGFPRLLVTRIKVFSRIFKVNNNIFQGYILSNSLIYVPLKKSGSLTKLWKGHIKFWKSWLHIKFKDFSRTWKWTNFFPRIFKVFQGCGSPVNDISLYFSLWAVKDAAILDWCLLLTHLWTQKHPHCLLGQDSQILKNNLRNFLSTYLNLALLLTLHIVKL